MSPNSTVATYKQQVLAELELDNSDIRRQVANYEARNDPKEEARTNRKCDNACKSISLRADSTEISLIQLADAKHAQAQTERQVQADTGVYRPPYLPEYLVLVATFLACGLFEIIFTTIAIASDGGAGFLEAAATGLLTTTVTMGLGCFGGYASRYIGYGANKRIRKNSDRFKHLLGATVSGITIAMAGLMSFGAARVRAVSGHKGILDFDTVSLLATYNDHLGLATSIIGALVFGVSFLKGRNSLTDKVPQLAELARYLSYDTDEDAIEITEDALLAIDETLARAEKAYIVSAPLPDEHSEIEGRIINHRSAIQTAKDECEAIHIQEHDNECFVKGRALPLPELSLSEFDRLLQGLELKPQFKPGDDGLESVRTAHAQASTKILQAHADYLASSKSYRVPPPNLSTTL